MPYAKRAGCAMIPQLLEPRMLLSSSFPNLNISKMPGSQAEGSIVVDPVTPSHLVAISNIDVGDGLMVATSSDSGATWSQRLIANNKDGLPPACCDPSVAMDSFGNLFVAYLNSDTNQVIVLLSVDAGQTFSLLTKFRGNVDQPTVVTGPGSVWVMFADSKAVGVTGAAVTGLNAVGSFSAVEHPKGSNNANFGDIAIGPAGQVIVTYQRQMNGGLSKLLVNVDADGVGPGKFGKAITVTNTRVGDFDFIQPQNNRGIDAEAGLAFDRSGGPFTGRVYLVYTDELPGNSQNTDIYLRYSDNGGSVWSNPIRVNDDTGVRSQFLPRISLDQTTGSVAVSWYDSRNDNGTGGTGDTDNRANDDAEYFAAVVTPQSNGLIVSPNQQISDGPSNADDAKNSIDLGDYTGLDFFQGTLHPLWFDNSNSTGDNPDGAHHSLDVYTSSVAASAFAAGTTTALGGLSDPSGPVAALSLTGGANPGFVKSGHSYLITVNYSAADSVDLSSISSTNLLITGPNGFSADAQLVRARPRKGNTVLATYIVNNPAGNWTANDAGVYTITLEPNQIVDGRARPSTSGLLGDFVVGVGIPTSHPGGTGSRHHFDPDQHID